MTWIFFTLKALYLAYFHFKIVVVFIEYNKLTPMYYVYQINFLCIILVIIFRTVVLIFIVVSWNKHFGCCILQLSSGIPSLSEHRNDPTWEIIIKVWLLIKQGIQEPTTVKLIMVSCWRYEKWERALKCWAIFHCNIFMLLLLLLFNNLRNLGCI